MTTDYTIVATNSSLDVRAAADACNRELMAAGETHDLRAVEEKIRECHPALREALRIDSREWEIWEAWEDGAAERESFRVEAGAEVDIKQEAAWALGVEVSERLNVRRIHGRPTPHGSALMRCPPACAGWPI